MKWFAGPLAGVLVALGGGTTPTLARADELVLKPSRDLAPPAPKTETMPAAPARPGQPRPAPTPKTEEAPRGVLFLRADRIDGNEDRITAEGDVELRSRYETVLADWLNYDVINDEVWAKGNVVIRRGLDWITGPELRFTRDTEIGFFKSPRFFVADVSGSGSAGEIKFVGPDRYDVADARYTTCVAPNRDWYLKSDELEVDNLRKVATARRASVFFMDVPVIYSPWLEFPLSNERKSGFLTPTMGSSGVRGFEFSTPYYWNLAPNYDATITPRLMTKRGLQLGAQFRYLLGDATAPLGQATGEINVEGLNDRVTGEPRYLLDIRHNELFAPWLAGFINATKVSDNTYFADLADRVAITSQKTLVRDAGFLMSSGPWALLTRAQSFQTLQDPNQPVTPPYNRLPQILGTLRETDWMGLTWGGSSEYVDFAQGALTPTGSRFVAYPQIAWNQRGAAWFFTARGSVNYRQYSLDATTPAFPQAHPDVTVPIARLDAGLVVEREERSFDTDA